MNELRRTGLKGLMNELRRGRAIALLEWPDVTSGGCAALCGTADAWLCPTETFEPCNRRQRSQLASMPCHSYAAGLMQANEQSPRCLSNAGKYCKLPKAQSRLGHTTSARPVSGLPRYATAAYSGSSIDCGVAVAEDANLLERPNVTSRGRTAPRINADARAWVTPSAVLEPCIRRQRSQLASKQCAHDGIGRIRSRASARFGAERRPLGHR